MESSRDLSYQVWVAMMVGQLLAHASAITCPPTRNRIAAVVSAFAGHVREGSNAALAHLIGCSKYTISDCCRGEQLLQLGTLLKLCETVGVSLLRLLTDEDLLTSLPPIPTAVLPPPRPYQGPYRQVDKAELQQRLRAEVANPTDPPKSLHAVAQQLGFDLSYLVKQCPGEAESIKARYAAYVQQRKQRTREQSFAELRQVMTRLAAEGIYPSQKRVAAQLSRSWFLRLPEGRAVWQQMLAELGKEIPTDETRKACVSRAGGGSNAALARLLGCSKYTIRDCCRGEQLLQLRTLLKLSETGGVSLLRLLTDETLLVGLSPIASTICNLPATYRGPYRKVDKVQLRQRLQTEVTSSADPPKSFHAVAEEIGFDPSYLVKQCPDEAQVIKARYEAYVKDRKQHLREASFAELRQVMTRLAADGIYPSQKRVAAELSHGWFLRLPEARAAWRHMLVELGKEASRDEST